VPAHAEEGRPARARRSPGQSRLSQSASGGPGAYGPAGAASHPCLGSSSAGSATKRGSPGRAGARPAEPRSGQMLLDGVIAQGPGLARGWPGRGRPIRHRALSRADRWGPAPVHLAGKDSAGNFQAVTTGSRHVLVSGGERTVVGTAWDREQLGREKMVRTPGRKNEFRQQQIRGSDCQGSAH